jgi:hypothetical protein
MNTTVEFSSDLFKPFLPEISQVNPQTYGAELAFWLSKELAATGIITSYPNYEDWGWFIEYITESEDEYWLCCSNKEGSDTEWLVYLDPKAKSLFGRNKAKPENAILLLDSLSNLLEKNQNISNIKWSSGLEEIIWN